MDSESLKNLWSIYKVFCSECAKNKDLDPNSAPSFLGWLEFRDEIGNSRYLNGFTDGYVKNKKESTKLVD